MKTYLTAFFLVFSSCSTIIKSEAEKLIGTWENTENRPSGITIIKIDSAVDFKADGAYKWSITEGTAAPVETEGTYKVGSFGVGIAAVLYNNAGKVVTNALYFRFVKSSGAADNLETSLHSSFEQSKIWIKK